LCERSSTELNLESGNLEGIVVVHRDNLFLKTGD